MNSRFDAEHDAKYGHVDHWWAYCLAEHAAGVPTVLGVVEYGKREQAARVLGRQDGNAGKGFGQVITLDPDFDTYAIVSSENDGSAFVFLIYDEEFSYGQSWPVGATEAVECFSYSNCRGKFTATKREDGKWEARRDLVK
jgi:hypothetical protein